MIVRVPMSCLSEHATVFPEHPEQLVANSPFYLACVSTVGRSQSK